MTAFKGIGVLIFMYSLYAIYAGEVYAKDKWSGRTIRKVDEPGYYWGVIAIYIVLSIACFLLF